MLTASLSRRRGVTLIELVVSLAVMLILASVALPSFTSYLRGIAVRSSSETVFQGLQLARAEAVRRNTRVRFVIASDTGWTVSTDAGTSIQSKPASEGGTGMTVIFTPGASRRVTFNAFGQVTDNADSSQALTQIDFSASGTTVTRSVEIGTGGELSLCDPSVNTSTDPMKC